MSDENIPRITTNPAAWPMAEYGTSGGAFVGMHSVEECKSRGCRCRNGLEVTGTDWGGVLVDGNGTVTRENLSKQLEVSDFKEVREVSSPVMGYIATRGRVVYDINYSIQLLEQILAHVERNKFDGKNLSFTLSQSIRQMKNMLEVERDQMK